MCVKRCSFSWKAAAIARSVKNRKEERQLAGSEPKNFGLMMVFLAAAKSARVSRHLENDQTKGRGSQRTLVGLEEFGESSSIG